MLCIDVGNSHIYGGVLVNDEISLRFRHTSKVSTSDELGIFLKTVLRENDCSPDSISRIGICSVVPQLDYSLRAACVKYFAIEADNIKFKIVDVFRYEYFFPQKDEISTVLCYNYF